MSTKKGTKKESTKKEVAEPTYQVKDVVLGKVKGFRAWPGVVVDPENVPPAVKKERPNGKKSSTYVVQFFPAGDYAWLTPKDISKLQKHEIESFLSESGQAKQDLIAGYKAALNPDEWLDARQAELDAVGDDDDEEGEPVDELASGDEEGGKSSKSKKRASSATGGGKKRKREETLSSAGEKSGKKKRESSSAATGKKGAKGGKKNGKSKETVESEDDGAEDEDGGAISKKATPPPTKKTKKDDGEDTTDPEALKVREWRHKLQKIFLSAKSPAKESEMPGMDNLFKTIEAYDKMDVGYLSFSKIGKVMRHIAALQDDKVPNDEEYRFRERAKKLVDQWHTIVGPTKEKEANGTNGTTNGNHPNGDAGELSMMGDVTMDTDAGGEL